MGSKLTERRRRRKSRTIIRRKRRRKRRRVEIDGKRKKKKGKNSWANLAQNDLDISDNEDFMFLAWDPTLAQSLQPDNWILDSGCSYSIVRNKNNFFLYISIPPHKISGIGDTSSSGHGNVPLSFALSSSTHAYVLRDMLYCPSAPFNLISVSWLTNVGYQLRDHCTKIFSLK